MQQHVIYCKGTTPSCECGIPLSLSHSKGIFYGKHVVNCLRLPAQLDGASQKTTKKRTTTEIRSRSVVKKI